ncbi:type II secretion system F family protein [Paraburkholderia sediminicola]|uniref:type II secretion system F family protein n=1 Tax=Paraburkholderia sediminicola TaxID=458836 RepID=UPI0038B73173
MNKADLFTLASFFVAVLLGGMYLVGVNLLNNRRHARISTRMRETFPRAERAKRKAGVDESVFKVDSDGNVAMRWLRPKLSRLQTVAGKNGLRIVVGAGIFTFVASLIAVRLLPLPDFTRPLVPIILPLFIMMRTYSYLVERFRRLFLDAFPDAIDLIVRAVRAGVPITHVLAAAADECPEPLSTEFRIMGDSLKVGRDLKEVLAVAVPRILIADFSFFCVCLLLQRETGGQLGETLENLAAIVRTRREIRQKTRALTAEARITTKILGAIPVIIIMSMYALNRTYITILFDTESGQKLMTFAVISVVFGIAFISKLSKLDTSR